jgi:hypothetical protein
MTEGRGVRITVKVWSYFGGLAIRSVTGFSGLFYRAHGEVIPYAAYSI